jgi:hypothetical protein
MKCRKSFKRTQGMALGVIFLLAANVTSLGGCDDYSRVRTAQEFEARRPVVEVLAQHGSVAVVPEKYADIARSTPYPLNNPSP